VAEPTQGLSRPRIDTRAEVAKQAGVSTKMLAVVSQIRTGESMTIEQFAKQEIELLARRRAAATAITAAESAAGAALLDAVEGDTASLSVDQIERARAELAQLDAAIKICRTRRLGAVRTKRQGEAGALRRQMKMSARGKTASLAGSVSAAPHRNRPA
jgi:hypothetical protein